MSIEALDFALRRRAEERDRISDDLLDLDSHPAYQLLEGARLTGETRRHWDEAQARAVTLWWLFDAYRGVLDRAQKLRAGKPDLAALTGLLAGPSVELKPENVPVEKRSLLRAAGEWITLDTVVARMDAAYRDVAETVAAADTAWGALLPRLDEADAARRSAQDLLRDLDGDDPELDRIGAGIDRVRAEITADPLGSAALGGELDGLIADLTARRALLEQAARIRADYGDRARRLGDRIARVAEAENEARSIRDTVLVKIASPALPALPDQAAALRDRLGALRTARDRWLELAGRLTELEGAVDEALARARSATESMAGLLGRRDELRGRLGAYHAKVVRLGHGEDAALGELYGRARTLLWTAPCDLRQATVAVAAYQQAISRIGVAG
ncbi:hypothetical protein Aph01nite_34630 [Acrocarpospora phusangensis]|uniref:Uncharacterized protein n=1 Tax=Acrocarpospora phusangensis TaxID=1070424 RepID=A0A919QCY7_9ACTN|nr:hypothetical protein [Acrocarpospora phusangensis]GIH25153.1 hypothetical protein Aph01nite_34630 [Acrocarpospora phusangensis]